ncbi:MAG: P-loop NTPase fold protein, partial [Gammaproteobacteria bacterium]
FKELVREILALAPSLVETVKELGLGAAQAGLPLLTFLSSIRKAKRGRSIHELSDRIAGAVGKIAKRRDRLVFLIDDLDRCHDPEQVVGLLEQIKLFLHLEHCLFFIFADRGQILAAIEQSYPGEGVSYLEKFVQLSLDLPPHDSLDLARLVPLDAQSPDDKPLYAYWERLAIALGHNPRRIKKLWNRTRVCLDLVVEELNGTRPPGSTVPARPASPYLMTKWLLMMEHGFLDDPYAYLGFEAAFRSSDGRSPIEEAHEHFLRDGKQALTAERRRVLMFLWQDRDAHRYDHPAVVSLYARAAGMDLGRPRAFLEEEAFAGRRQFRRMDFSEADLRGGVFSSLSFNGCDLRHARFDDANLRACQFEDCNVQGASFTAARLQGTRFRACGLLDACFDGAEVKGTSWIHCRNIDGLTTDAATYEAIADIMAGQWRSGRGQPWAGADREQLYKTYQ